MSLHSDKSLTLIELLVAVSILGLLVIGLSNIDTFSHFQVISSDRRVKLQHDAAYVLERMAQQIGRAIGNERINGSETVVDVNEATDSESTRIRVFIDANRNGQREPLGAGPPPGPNNDHWIVYRFSPGGSPNEVQYCDYCRNKKCQGGNCASNWELLSNKIISFTVTKPNVSNTLTDNYVEVQLTACWDPGNSATCGSSVDNPKVEMSNRINMPSVSVN